MSPLAKRLILTAVALPAVYVLAAMLTGATHLAMACVVSLVMAGGAAETGGLLKRAGLPSSRLTIPILAATIPAVTYLETAGILPSAATLLWLCLLLCGILAHSALAAERRPLAEGLPRVAALAMELFYPALPGSFIVRLAGLHESSAVYILFFCLVFGNDMAAYAAGRAMSPRTVLNLKVSPSKTGAGFIAGFLVTVGFALLLGTLMRSAFPHPPLVMAALGAATALSTFAGDLAESAMKRSAGVKDSGGVMFGRGGILDSVDSLAMSAPVFYLFLGIVGA